MDTPESPTQSPQSPEEEEKGFSDSELLDSPDEDEDGVISDSEIVHEEENGELDDDEDDDDEEALASHGGDSDRDEDDEVVPDFVSDPEDEEPVGETEEMGQEDGTIVLMDGDEDGPQGGQLDGEDDKEGEEQEDGVIDTPQSPDSDQGKSFIPEEDGEDYRKNDFADPETAEVDDDDYDDDDDDDDDGEEDKSMAQEDEEDNKGRKAVVVREMKDDPASVSRELDEHELDYDEEVPEEPSIPAHEEEEDEEDTKVEGEEENEDKRNKKEKKIILPPSPKDSEIKRSGDSKGPERMRRDSFRDKKKDEDDGEIDEGEIDDDDLEEGEVKDPSDRKIRPRPICRFFIKGNCTWGMNCRFIHPGVNDKGNYSLISKPDPFSPNGAPPGGPHPLIPNNPWAGPAVEELPPPPPPVEPPVESAWERGLRHAKEVLKKATIRKEQEPDFEEKRFNVTIGEDDREFDKENEFFRERSYRIIRDEMEFRDPVYSDPYADPYYDYEMEALWRGGQYENFRVQYTEAPLPYHYSERERERDPRDRPRDRERERDHRERERRQREREREREREKERMRRKEEWERDRMKRDEKERPRMRPPRDPREKKDEDKVKPRSPLGVPPKPMEPPSKKEDVPVMRRPDEWKDPWRRSKSPRRRPGLGSPPRGRRRHRPSGSSVSLSNSSRSSSRSSSYTGSGSSRSRSRSSSFSSYSSHSSQRSSFSGSRSRSRSFSTSPSPSPAAQRNAKNKLDLPPVLPKGMPLKPGAMPPPRREKPAMKKAPSPPPGPQGRPSKPLPEGGKPPANPREPAGAGGGAGTGGAGRPPPSREPGKTPNPREDRRKERQQHPPRRSLSVSSVSSVSSASSSGSSVRSADSDDMYADLASPVSSASSHSPTPNHPRKERAAARDRPPHGGRDKNRERPSKKDEPFREDRRKIDPSGAPPRGGHPMPRSGPGSRGGHPVHPPPGIMGPPGSYGGSGSHKDIKLTLLNKQADKGNRKRYLPADKDRPGSPLSKRMAMSPDRARDKRIPGRPMFPPRMDRPRGPGPRPMPPQGDRKRALSPPAKSSGKGPAPPPSKPPAPGSASAAGSGSNSNKPSNTLSRREELLKQLKAVEDAIARKRAKIPAK
ncbi:zinc finger CCCH domain-containing protein 18 isoform X3 [Clinocottus analis]|uniref:zinc finger CCCH domain-containing protein 18 isoform X3 n=1 Tax=Clinocottus analis TaxID=304258 RepID=UPI0035BEDFDC